MLIIWGFRVRLKTLASLVFFCPKCGGDRAGLRREARRWFTVFWIPLIPLKHLGEVVQCQTCHTSFDPAVADRPTTADLGAILANAVRVLVAMVVRTGDSDDPALRAAAVATVASASPGYDERTLMSDAEVLDPTVAEEYVAPLADGLEVAGRERMLSDLVRVALAGGTITPDQRRVIEAAGRGLGLTPAHVTGVVSSVAAASDADSPESPTT